MNILYMGYFGGNQRPNASSPLPPTTAGPTKRTGDAFTFVTANLIVDVLYTYLNPRIKM